MARINLENPIQVLVCDGRLGTQEFGSYADGEISTTDAVQHVLSGLGKNFEITRVNNLGEVINSVTRFKNTEKVPYYALVVYASYHISEGTGGMKIHELKNWGPFLPQMVYGSEISFEALEKAMRRGVRYAPRSIEHLKEKLANIFWQPEELLKNLAVVKIGGSAIEFDSDYSEYRNIRHVIEELIRIKEAKPKTRKEAKQQMIITTGAGNPGNDAKVHLNKYKDTEHEFAYLMARALEFNLRKVYSHFRGLNAKRQILDTEDFFFVHPDFARVPILMSIAPHWIRARDSIPLADSDAHTVAIAEFYGAKRIILVKRTDGIYDQDPYRGFILDKSSGHCTNYDNWRVQQSTNRRHTVVTIDDLLNGNFSREGTGVDGKPDGSQGHLMEDSGLQYFRDCKNVQEIAVVHIAPEEMYHKKNDGAYEHIVTGETVQLDANGWRGVLSRNLDAAFSGQSYSKIVR